VFPNKVSDTQRSVTPTQGTTKTPQR